MRYRPVSLRRPLCLCLLLIALLCPAMTSQVWAKPILRWGADPSGGAPYIFANPAKPSEYIGYEKEFVEALAQIMGDEPKMVRANWDMLVPALNRKTFDIAVNGLEPTADRAKQILFSKPYYLFQLELTVHRDETRIKKLADCKGKRVATLVNTAASRLLDANKIKYRGYDDLVPAYRDLRLKRIDAVLIDYPIAMYHAHPHPTLKAACPPFHRGAYVIGMRKGDTALKKKLDAAITTLQQNGTLERILRKWKLWNAAQVELAGGKASYKVTKYTFHWGGALEKLAKAALITMGLAFGAMFLALLLGLPLALAQLRGPRWLQLLCLVYVEFFRGTPVLVQLLFLYFVLPMLGITIPNWLTAIIGLGLNYAAYESQIYRAALESIPPGQWEAAYVLGMSPRHTFVRIILPQAFRVALPPMTNDFVALFKDTSVAFAIAVWELATTYRELASATQEFLILGVITSGFYLAMSIPLSYYARRLEERMKQTVNAP